MKITIALPLLAAALSVAACAKQDEATNAAAADNVTLNEVPADDLGAGNVVVPEDGTPDNAAGANAAETPSNAG